MTAPTLTYVPNSTCQGHLSDLTLVGDYVRPRVLRVGQKMICEDCGREWQVVQKIGFGGIVMVEWQCFRPPNVSDPMVAVQARLDALEAANTAAGTNNAALAARLTAAESANTALTGRVTTLETTNTALTGRVAALEAKKVDVRRSLPTSTAAIAIGGTQTLTVTWKTPFPDANYVVEALPVHALIGKVTPTVTGKTATGCTITVTSTVIVALATPLLDVTAVRYA